MARPGMPPVPMGAQQVRPQQSFKYTPTARSPPTSPAGCPRARPGAFDCLHVGSRSSTGAEADAAERLFPLIQRMFPDLAGKITGMLLEIDNAELVHMLEDQNSLKGKVEEAVAVLQAHQGKAGDKK